jgi:hypothetical protein
VDAAVRYSSTVLPPWANCDLQGHIKDELRSASKWMTDDKRGSASFIFFIY